MDKLLPLSALIVGDVMIDHIVDISELNLPPAVLLDSCIFSQTQTSLGGNGFFFAKAALEAQFDSSYLLATLGMDKNRKNLPDIVGRTAIESLEASGVELISSLDISKETGQTIILYQPNYRMMMIANRGANENFRLANFEIESILKNGDLLYISGYSLLYEQQRKEVQALMQKCKEHGLFIFVDIVPHNIFQTISYERFEEWIDLCDAVSCDISTIMEGLLIDKNESIEQHKFKIIDALLNKHELCIIRVNDRSDFVFASRNNKFEACIPHKNASLCDRESLRLTDRVVAHILHSYLKNNRSLINNSLWLDSLIKLVQ